MLRHRLKNFYDSTALHVPGHRFEPDLAYIDEARGIFIDIEVDEPYTFARRIPTHAMGRDDERNRLVTEAGWVVLRFSEQQALTTPERVARTVIDVVRTIAPDVPMPRALREVEPAVPEPRWDYQEARRRAATHASDTYQRRNILYRLMNLCR
jgi:DNA replication ATP-dependent helicase Dna2